jgi:hypothetical protein
LVGEQASVGEVVRKHDNSLVSARVERPDELEQHLIRPIKLIAGVEI